MLCAARQENTQCSNAGVLSFVPCWAFVKGAELECAGTAVQAAFTEKCIIGELQT